jgi:hypothetical protein
MRHTSRDDRAGRSAAWYARPIGRRPFTFAAAVSAVLWVITATSAEISSGHTGLCILCWTLYPAPDWLLLVFRSGPLVFAVLPLTWVVTRRRSKRPPPVGLCPACGYDLRATPQAGGALLSRCPECGAVPVTPAGQTTPPVVRERGRA